MVDRHVLSRQRPLGRRDCRAREDGLVEVDDAIPSSSRHRQLPLHAGLLLRNLVRAPMLDHLGPFVLLLLDTVPLIDLAEQSRVHVRLRELVQEVHASIA